MAPWSVPEPDAAELEEIFEEELDLDELLELELEELTFFDELDELLELEDLLELDETTTLLCPWP